MDELIREFENKMHLEGKSDTTIKSYTVSVNEFFRWFNDSFGEVGFKKLYRENILEYKSYLKNVKTCKRTGQNLNAKSINAKLSGLIKYNELMQPDSIVISKADMIVGLIVRVCKKIHRHFYDKRLLKGFLEQKEDEV